MLQSDRRWATERLHEYMQKGFTLDDERLKQGGNRYFQELLQRIRDIRSSERNFYQKVTDIYATATDYDATAETTRKFFATVKNKLHYAVRRNAVGRNRQGRGRSGKPPTGAGCMRTIGRHKSNGGPPAIAVKRRSPMVVGNMAYGDFFGLFVHDCGYSFAA